MSTKSKKTKWAEVSCPIHGKPDPDSKVNGWKPKQVKLSLPSTKRERMSGCPICRKARNA